MEFKSSEELIARVEGLLDSYKAAGLLDSGDFHRWIKEIMVNLNVPAYNSIHSILKVENYKTLKPDDVASIWSLWSYDLPNQNQTFIEQQQENRFLYFKTTEECCKLDECDDSCNDGKIYEHNGDIIINKVFLKGERPVPQRFTNGRLINISNHKLVNCDGISPAAGKGGISATVSKNYIHLPFKEGFVYLQYYGFPIEEGLPMIPDQVQIEQAIETYIVYQFFLKQYLNNTFDARQRMQDTRELHMDAYSKALSWIKLPSVKSILRLAERKKQKFAKFELHHSRI